MLQADPRQNGNLRVRKDLLARLDLDHAFALNHPSNIDPERAPEEAKSFLIFRSNRNSPNDFATSRTRLFAGPSGSSLRYASRSWSCIQYSPLRPWMSAITR